MVVGLTSKSPGSGEREGPAVSCRTAGEIKWFAIGWNGGVVKGDWGWTPKSGYWRAKSQSGQRIHQVLSINSVSHGCRPAAVGEADYLDLIEIVFEYAENPAALEARRE